MVDSRPGIGEALNATLVDAGFAPVAGAALDAVIGPPLREGFETILAAQRGDVARVPELIAGYRARYATTSLTGTVLQPGIAEALGCLAEVATLAIASSKPLRFAGPLVERLGLASLFAAVVAPTPELDGETKTQTLARAIAVIEEGGGSFAHRAMIGDRWHDMRAARELGCRALGALWGYGSAHELCEAGAEALVATPADLPAVVGARTSRA